MSDFTRFGSPDLFEIAARWCDDTEPREHLPLDSGWSTGDLRITVGHQLLTARRIGGDDQAHVSWYLSPLFDWLIKQWTWLFHEEAYAWKDRAGAPASIAVLAALGRTIAASDEQDREEYQAVQNWWMRHALRAADSSALYPDICFRRVADEIEISWAGWQPAHAPDGFALVLPPGYATLSVEAVVKPLWEFLQWGLGTARVTNEGDRVIVASLKQRFQELKATPLRTLELRHLSDSLQKLIQGARSAVALKSISERVKEIPAIASLDAAVLMFGGLAPSIGARDVVHLLKFLARHESRLESAALLDLVSNTPTNPALAPYQEGYGLAEDAREDLGISPTEASINVQGILHALDIDVEEVALDTDTVRGVAVAGAGFSPAILVNTTHVFNGTREGRRFTMAHELCHILFDRTRAKRLSHVSGDWTNARVEKRANAFAAMFLASRSAIQRTFSGSDLDEIKRQAATLEIGVSALVEHLRNLGLIDESVRARLRAASFD